MGHLKEEAGFLCPLGQLLLGQADGPACHLAPICVTALPGPPPVGGERDGTGWTAITVQAGYRRYDDNFKITGS
jgi:hypothetical protein